MVGNDICSLFTIHSRMREVKGFSNLAVYIVFIISPRRVQLQLTPEEGFGKKSKRRVKF